MPSTKKLLKTICGIITAILLFPSIVVCENCKAGRLISEKIGEKKELVILCLGDSITAGSYPERFQANLDKAGIPAKVLNCGMSGYTSGNYLGFMKSFSLFEIVDPDIVLLQLGTNDVTMGLDYIETGQFAKNMENIVHLIREDFYWDNEPPLVLISTILPIKVLSPQRQESVQKMIEKINADIRTLSDKFGLTLVDNFELFKNHPMWLVDGIHPNEIGYQAMADKWFASLTQLISKESNSLKKTGFIYHGTYLKHDTGKNHPESADRLRAIIKILKEKGTLSELIHIKPSPALLEWITTIHTSEYVKEVEKSCQDGKSYLHSADTIISASSYEAACLAVGGVLEAIDAVMDGKVQNAFCAIRPPGHHALKNKAMGFCLFNNVAIGARYIQKKYGLSKVLIVDWDVHHGNGTQDTFYNDPSVLYFSIHQYPFYPGSGSEEEKGAGKGFGYNINVPLSAGCGNEEYIKAFEEKLKPEALEFNPDFVIISAGFDAYKDDPLGGMKVTTKGFAKMTRIVKEIAEEYCNGRIVSVLEGGYNLDGLARSVKAHISVLQE